MRILVSCANGSGTSLMMMRSGKGNEGIECANHKDSPLCDF